MFVFGYFRYALSIGGNKIHRETSFVNIGNIYKNTDLNNIVSL